MSAADSAGDADLEAVLAAVSARRGIDFRDYRREAISRGVDTRRVACGLPDLAAYHARVSADPDEIDALVDALVVPVSSFFRNAGVFEALRSGVIPMLTNHAGPSRTLRAWSVGTAKGEEAWSVAALFEERRLAWELADYDVLGSDIDEGSLAVARAAVYPTSGMAGPDRFFQPAGPDLVRIASEIRERVHFAAHDLVGRLAAPHAAVIASFHLVLCRNLLIYFDDRLKEKAFARLVAALVPGGVLVLGKVEGVPSPFRDRVRPLPGVDPSLRIFRVSS